MCSFVTALMNPDLMFLRNALLVGILSSVAFGIVGTFVVAKRISYVSGAISHTVLGGIGLALFISNKFSVAWLTPQSGAVFFAVTSAFAISFLSGNKNREREDSIMSTIWVAGMAIGVIFITKTPVYVNMESYLFGNILMTNILDIKTIIIVDITIVGLTILFYHKFLSVCFDDEFVNIRGISANLYYTTILLMTALTIVFMIKIVGIVMLIALLALPASTAAHFAKRLWSIMILSTFLTATSIVLGIYFSYVMDLPTGATIVLFSVLFYTLASLYKTFRRYLRQLS